MRVAGRCDIVPALDSDEDPAIDTDLPGPAGEAVDDDVHELALDGRELWLVGTAHVSRESVDLVRRVIDERRPDRVCVELDEQRYRALAERTQWERLDLKQVIRNRQLATLLANLLLASYQRRLGDALGVLPGTELLEAVRAAEAIGAEVTLADRDVRTTMLRAWRSMSLWQRTKLLTALVGSVFAADELSEEQLRELRRGDVLSDLLEELSRGLPTLKGVLIDERDRYLAERIRAASGRRIVAVVGAGHVAGIRRILLDESARPLEPLERIPPGSPVWRRLGWGVPVVVLGALAALAFTHGAKAAGESGLFWVLANGIPSSLGAAAALAHPLTILAAFVAAPLTSLSPLIGAGYVTAFVQAWVRPPLVTDVTSVVEDAGVLRRWWSNRLLRILLAFVFPGLGSVVGTFVGGWGLIDRLVG